MEYDSRYLDMHFDNGMHPTPMQRMSYSAQINQEIQNAIILQYRNKMQNLKKEMSVPKSTSFIGQHYGKIGMGIVTLAGFAAYWLSTSSNGTAQPKSI